MARRKLTDDQTRALLDDYDRWQKFDPDAETADELAKRHGVTKATLYRLLETRERDRSDVAADVRRTAKSPVTSPGGEDQGLEAVVRYLTEELIKARIEVAENRRRIEALEAKLGEEPQ